VARELDDPAYLTSAAHRILQENDLNRGWTPTQPILFCHSPMDDDVDFQQTVSTMDFLGAEILKAGGDPGKLLTLKPIGDCRDRITHVAAIPKALAMAFHWIHQSLAAN
jgi:hypothetical protein